MTDERLWQIYLALRARLGVDLFLSDNSLRDRLWAEAEKELQFIESKELQQPELPPLSQEILDIKDVFDGWLTQYWPALTARSLAGGTDVRKLYELEYAMAGLVDMCEAVGYAFYVGKALELMENAISTFPWLRSGTGDRWLLEDIKATRSWGKVCWVAETVYGMDVSHIKTFLDTHILKFWLDNPLWGYPSGEEWMRTSHKEGAPGAGNGHWHNHQTMCANLCKYMGLMGYTRWGDLSSYLVGEFLAKKVVVNGAWLWDIDSLREGDIDSWHTNRNAWWMVDEGIDVSDLVVTFNQNIFDKYDAQGWPEFNEYIDGSNDCANCPPAPVQVYGGWNLLGEYDDQALEVCRRVYERVVNGPYSGLLYSLNSHPDGYRQLMLASGLARALRRRQLA